MGMKDTPYNVRFYVGEDAKALCGRYHSEWEVSHMELVSIKQVGGQLSSPVKLANMYHIEPTLQKP